MRVEATYSALMVVAIVIAATFSLSAQTPVEPQSCEYLKNALDYTLIEARKDEAAYVDLVFRPGKKERSTKYSRERTKFILKYLKYRDNQFDRLLISHRHADADLGRLDIFIKKELRWSMYFRKNRTGFASCVE